MGNHNLSKYPPILSIVVDLILLSSNFFYTTFDCYLQSAPVVLVSDQIPTALEGTKCSFQDAPIAKENSKKYATQPEHTLEHNWVCLLLDQRSVGKESS